MGPVNMSFPLDFAEIQLDAFPQGFIAIGNVLRVVKQA
jgi:hypothetical protein